MNMQCVHRGFISTAKQSKPTDIEQTLIFILWLQAAETVYCVQREASVTILSVNWLLSVLSAVESAQSAAVKDWVDATPVKI